MRAKSSATLSARDKFENKQDPSGLKPSETYLNPESLPYAVRVVAAQAGSGSDTALDALNQLQTSLRERKIDTELWEQDLMAERQASDRRLSPAPK